MQDATAGDPIRGTKWTHKTLDKLVSQLHAKRFHVGRGTVHRLLVQLGYTLYSNRKRLSKRQDAQRDCQMRYIGRTRRAFLKAKKPVISVDTKKKELIGNFKNAGRTWRRVPLDVLVTDFPNDADGKAIPYGIYDVTHNRGYVVVGTSHETAAFAVNAIRRWWRTRGRRAFPRQRHLLIQADAGGANDARSWLWKWELQKFADESGLTLTVTHYPTSASKWNLIEHRLFCHISRNWAGQPLIDYETVLNFIRTTRTRQGLRCGADLDNTDYPTKLTLTPQQKDSINLTRRHVRPKWNYTIAPRKPSLRK